MRRAQGNGFGPLWPSFLLVGVMLPEGWRTLFSRSFHKVIPVVLRIVNKSLVVKIAKNFLQSCFGATLAITPLVAPALMVRQTGRYLGKFGQNQPSGW